MKNVMTLKCSSKYSREGGGRMQGMDELGQGVAQAEGLVDGHLSYFLSMNI